MKVIYTIKEIMWDNNETFHQTYFKTVYNWFDKQTFCHITSVLFNTLRWAFTNSFFLVLIADLWVGYQRGMPGSTRGGMPCRLWWKVS